MEVVVTTGTISRAKLQSNRHHQQTNTQFFTGRMPFLLGDRKGIRFVACKNGMPFLSPNQQYQSNILYIILNILHIIY